MVGGDVLVNVQLIAIGGRPIRRISSKLLRTGCPVAVSRVGRDASHYSTVTVSGVL